MPQTLPVIVQFGGYHCSECAQVLSFEGGREFILARDVIGMCVNRWGCTLNGVRIRVRLAQIHCDVVLPREMEHGDL